MGLFLESEPDVYIWRELKTLRSETIERQQRFFDLLDQTIFSSDEYNLQNAELKFSDTELRLLGRIELLMAPKYWHHFNSIYRLFVRENLFEDREVFSAIFNNKLPEILTLPSNLERSKIEMLRAAKEKMEQFRVESLVNAEADFKAYFLGLKDNNFGENWDFYKLSDFLKTILVSSKFKTGLQDFLNHFLAVLNHPVIAYYLGDIYFSISFKGKMINGIQSERIHRFIFKNINFQTYDLLYLNNEWGKTGSTTQGRGASSARALLFSVRELLEEEDGEIIEITVRRENKQGEFINFLTYVYSEFDPRELVEHYFRNWEFFISSRDCISCGHLLTNPISVAAGKGPECGDHGYKYAETQIPNIRKIILALPRSRVFSKGSPIIQKRIQKIDRTNARDEVVWLKLIDGYRNLNLKNFSIKSLDDDIRNYIHYYHKS